MIPSQMLKGVLEGCILEIISRQETYGYEIAETLSGYGFGRIAEGTQANAAAGAAIPEPGSPVSSDFAQGGELDASKKVQGLPQQMEAQFDNLPNIAKKTALAQGAMHAR